MVCEGMCMAGDCHTRSSCHRLAQYSDWPVMMQLCCPPSNLPPVTSAPSHLQYFVAIVNYDAALAFGGDGKTAAAYTEVGIQSHLSDCTNTRGSPRRETQAPSQACRQLEQAAAMTNIPVLQLPADQKHILRAHTEPVSCNLLPEPLVDDELVAPAQVSSIGSIGGEKNADIVAALTAVLEQRLGVPSDRCYINVSALLGNPDTA
jgi:Macrophage migration inhibitory factor (MIF)